MLANQHFRNAWGASLFFALTTLGFAAATNANEIIAVLQISDDQGWVQTIYQTGVKDKRLCKKLNEAHWAGLRTTCPQCKKDFEGCIDEFSPAYKGLLNNKPIVFPYLSSRGDRIVFWGLPVPKAIDVCRTIVKEYQKSLKRDAQCIVPNY